MVQTFFAPRGVQTENGTVVPERTADGSYNLRKLKKTEKKELNLLRSKVIAELNKDLKLGDKKRITFGNTAIIDQYIAGKINIDTNLFSFRIVKEKE